MKFRFPFSPLLSFLSASPDSAHYTIHHRPEDVTTTAPREVHPGSQAGVRETHLLQSSQTGSRTTQPSYSLGAGGSFPRLKCLGREADHSLLFSAEAKSVWSCTFTLPYVFMACREITWTFACKDRCCVGFLSAPLSWGFELKSRYEDRILGLNFPWSFSNTPGNLPDIASRQLEIRFLPQSLD
jgi:hypothetical protein